MATFNSTEYANQLSSFQKVPVDTIAKLFLAKFSHTFLAGGVAADDINLIELPAGKITIYPDLSRLVASAGGGTQTTSVGFRAHVNSANVPVAANLAQLESVRSTVSATDAALALPAVGALAMDSRNGLLVAALNAATAWPVSMTMSGWIAYTRG